MTTSGLEMHETHSCTEMVDKESFIRDWILVTNPFPVVAILVMYLIMLKTGPVVMASREPYNLKTTMRVYNVLQVMLNAYLVIGFFKHPEVLSMARHNACSLVQEANHDSDVIQTGILWGWWYLVIKILDLFDTMFMILRKKNSHITVLHVYHHASMVLFTYSTFSIANSPHGITIASINVLVHVVMYCYYFIATFPQFEKYLWWKKHLTKLQMGQFVLILTYLILLYIRGCPISRSFAYAWMINVSVFTVLFINFYVKAYIVKSTRGHRDE